MSQTYKYVSGTMVEVRDAENAEESSSSEESLDAGDGPTRCRKPVRVITVTACMLAIVGAALVAFKQAVGSSGMNTKSASPHSPRNFAELFETDQMAEAMSNEVLWTVGADAKDAKKVEAPLKRKFKADFHAAVAHYRQQGPHQARQLAAPITDQGKEMILALLSKIHTPQARDLGAKVHQVMHDKQDKSDEELHQIIMTEHGSLIRRYAAELFPNFLTGEFLSSEDTKKARRLQWDGPADFGTDHGVVVGLAAGGLATSVVASILTMIDLFSSGKFNPKIPQWMNSALAVIGNGLGVSACVLAIKNTKESIANVTAGTQGVDVLNKMGVKLSLGVHVTFPGWLKCAIFQGITGIISIVNLIIDFLPKNINKLVGPPYNMGSKYDPNTYNGD
mmetsp:Transcript_42457/g.74428  ORF Transcript_42457/g.74428 Transcript_42457/m.74428 type:complete len:392 (-) Transcript_42457:125-1300(-)